MAVKTAEFLKEQVDKMLYKSSYIISESPTYKSILEDAVFDEIPEAEAPAPEENPMPSSAPATSTPPQSNAAPAASPAPTSDAMPPVAPSPAPAPTTSPAPAPEVSAAPPMGATNGFSEPAPVVDEKEEMQKEVMRLQIEAMKQMSAKITEMESVVDGLNAQLAEFSKEVDKVKEPTDIEKFQERKLDSHPYYYNLNDLWNNNTFQARMDGMNSKGITKTDDGYVADFDQLPKLSQYEVKNSFDNFN